MNNLSKERRPACGANMRPGGVNLRDYIIGGVKRITQRGAGSSNSRQAEDARHVREYKKAVLQSSNSRQAEGIRHASACVR